MIGAGVMGAGIAAHVANAGVPVVLLDIVPEAPTATRWRRRGRENAEDRAGAVHAQARGEAGRRPATSRTISASSPTATGSSRRSSRRLEVKQALYAKAGAVRQPGSIVSSNTSTIPLARADRTACREAFRARLPDHAFLQSAALHAAAGSGGGPGDRAAMRGRGRALRRRRARQERGARARTRRASSPTGSASTGCSARSIEAIDLGLTVEEADAVMGRPIGIPKTGVFGLIDLVGIDLGPQVNALDARALPQGRSVPARSTATCR